MMTLKTKEIFEKFNGIIQVTIFVASLIIGAVFNIRQENQFGIIIGLLLLLVGEFVSLNIKDGITQRKLNDLGVRFEIFNGALFRVHDFNLTDFFEKTNNQFFVSGMALNGFFEKNKSIIERFLKEGKVIFVLIAGTDSVVENTKLYHGADLEEETFAKRVNDIFHKQIITLDYIDQIENIYDYIESGKFKLKVINSAISTSFVAYDIFEKELLVQDKSRGGKELKASFYQYKCTNPENEPNILVDSVLSHDWYIFFKETIEKQWNDAKPISNKGELEMLYKKINDKISENNNLYRRDNNT